MKIKKRSVKKTLIKNLVKINRNFIGSIDLGDIINVDKMTPTDRINYLKEAETLYNNPVFQNEIKKMVQTQLEFIAMQTTDQDQVYVGRGTISGLDLLMETINHYHNEYKQAIRPEENFNKFNPLPES